jgi:hypothetical protein
MFLQNYINQIFYSCHLLRTLIKVHCVSRMRLASRVVGTPDVRNLEDARERSLVPSVKKQSLYTPWRRLGGEEV